MYYSNVPFRFHLKDIFSINLGIYAILHVLHHRHVTTRSADQPIDLDFDLDFLVFANLELKRVKAEGQGAVEGLLMPQERANVPVKLSLPLVNIHYSLVEMTLRAR